MGGGGAERRLRPTTVLSTRAKKKEKKNSRWPQQIHSLEHRTAPLLITARRRTREGNWRKRNGMECTRVWHHCAIFVARREIVIPAHRDIPGGCIVASRPPPPKSQGGLLVTRGDAPSACCVMRVSQLAGFPIRTGVVRSAPMLSSVVDISVADFPIIDR